MGCLLAKPVYNPDDFVKNEETFNRDDMLPSTANDLEDSTNKSGQDFPDENSIQLEREEEEERQMLQEQSRLKLQALALQLGEASRLEEQTNTNNSTEIDSSHVQISTVENNNDIEIQSSMPPVSTVNTSSLTPYNDDTISELESVVTLNSTSEGNPQSKQNNKSKNYYKNKNKNKKDKSYNK